MTTVPPSPLDLADVARLARTALQADALVVVDERHRPPALVLAEGDSADLLAALQDLDASSGRHAAADVRTSLVGRRRVISMPLAVDAMVPIAVLHVMQATDAPVRADEEALIRAFGRHLALALERGPSSGPVERETGVVFRWDDLDRLPEARNEITGAVTEFLRPLTGATAVGITVWDPDRRILHALPGAFGATDGELAASVTGPVTNMRSAGARVFATGQPYLSNRASGDPGILQPYVEIFHINRILSIPLATGNRRIGVLHLVNKDSDFTAADVAATEAVAPHIAMAVELACSTARLVARQRLEGVLTSAAVAIASGRSVEDCLFPAFDDLGSVLAAAVIALVPLDAPPLLRGAGPSDPDRRFSPPRRGPWLGCAACTRGIAG